MEDTHAIVIPDALTPQECRALIEGAERRGFSGFGENGQVFAGRRDRLALEDPGLAALVWQRIAPFVAPWQHRDQQYDIRGAVRCVPQGDFVAHGLNPFIRFSRYRRGGEFTEHYDTNYARSADDVGFHTMLLYLNDDYEGGETVLRGSPVTPKTGTALVFYHHQLHSGAEVRSGTKYLIRTDVMFQRVRPLEAQ